MGDDSADGWDIIPILARDRIIASLKDKNLLESSLSTKLRESIHPDEDSGLADRFRGSLSSVSDRLPGDGEWLVKYVFDYESLPRSRRMELWDWVTDGGQPLDNRPEEDFPVEGSFGWLFEHSEPTQVHITGLDGAEARLNREEGRDILYLDPEQLPDGALERFAPQFRQSYEEEDGFPLEEFGDVASVANLRGGSKDRFDFFRDKIPEEYRTVLKEALVLNRLTERTEIQREAVREFRGDIADAYRDRAGGDPADAQTLCSLCGGGYFSEGALFERLYRDKVEEERWSEEDYQDFFYTAISECPFAVFVTPDAEPRPIYDEVIHEWIRKDNYKYHPGFVDIHAKGNWARPVLRDTMEVFGDRNPGFASETIEDGNQLVERVRLETL